MIFMKLRNFLSRNGSVGLKHRAPFSPANPEGNISNARFQDQSLDLNNESAENFTDELKQFRR